MTAMEEDIDDRFAGIDIDSLLNRVDRRPRNYGRKQYLYEAPEFTRRLNGEETVMEGQSLCLDCKVIGFPAPSLRWFKDDEEIVDHPRIRVESDGKGSYSLYIDKVNKGDEAAYRCRAENVEGSSSCYFFLSVRCKPKSKKKRDKNSSKKRSVSFPPMFSTIVEKVEEEDKLGKEQEIQPPSPMTQFYFALTLKGRQTWPSFLGDWAFRNEADTANKEDTTLNDNDDVFEENNNTSPPLFYLDDNDEDGEPKNKKTKKQTQISTTADKGETNKENILVKPSRTKAAVNAESQNQDGSNNNGTVANSVHDKVSRKSNRICLHVPQRIKDENEPANEDSDKTPSPVIFLEYTENDGMPSHAFQREERELTPFLKINQGGKVTKSDSLLPHRSTENAKFERESTPFFAKTKRPQSSYPQDNSFSESSPEREIEISEKSKSLFLTVPKAAFTFAGPVRAPRDSTPTPFEVNESLSDLTVDHTVGLRPPRESTPFFPKEDDDEFPKIENEESQEKNSQGKDTDQSDPNQSKIRARLPHTKEEGEVYFRYSTHDSFGDINGDKKLSSRKEKDKNAVTDIKLYHSPQDKSMPLAVKTKTAELIGKTSGTSKRQPENHNLSTNSANMMGMLSQESKVLNSSKIFQQNLDIDHSRKAASEISKHRSGTSMSKSRTTTDKDKSSESTGQLSNTTRGKEKGADQISVKSQMSSIKNADADTSTCSNVSVPSKRATAAQARRELYNQRKRQGEQAKSIAAKSTFVPINKATSPQASNVISKHTDEGKDVAEAKPFIKLQQPVAVKVPMQKSALQSSQPSSKPGTKHTLPSSDQVGTMGNVPKLKSVITSKENTIGCHPCTPGTISSPTTNVSRVASSSELQKRAKMTIFSPNPTKTITPATMIVKHPPTTPASLTKSTTMTQPSAATFQRNKRPSPPDQDKDSISKPSPKTQTRIDSSGAFKRTELYEPKQLSLTSLQHSINGNQTARTYANIQDPKTKTTPTKLKTLFSSTAMRNCNGNSEREKSSVSARTKLSPNTPADIQPKPKATNYRGDEIARDKISRSSNVHEKGNSPTGLYESFHRQDAAHETLKSPRLASMSLSDPIPLSSYSGMQNKMPICHRLQIKDKTKTRATSSKSSSGIAKENNEQNIMHNTLWSKLLKAFMNSFVNEEPQSKTEMQKPTKRRKFEKSKDSRSTKVKSKISRRKSLGCNWREVSPFGQYTFEGIFLLCIMTLVALSTEVRVEVFICYVLAAYYTFFVLRVLQILD